MTFEISNFLPKTNNMATRATMKLKFLFENQFVRKGRHSATEAPLYMHHIIAGNGKEAHCYTPSIPDCQEQKLFL